MKLQYKDDRLEIYEGRYQEIAAFILWKGKRFFVLIPAKYVHCAVRYLTEKYQGTKLLEAY